MTKAIAADDALAACPARDTVHRIIGDPSLPAKQADVTALVTVLVRMAGGDGAQAGKAAAALWTQARLVEPLGRPIGDVDPFDLEVHHAITVRGSAGLPAYMEREHDRELRRIVSESAAGHSRLVMLVGTSSSGKTRACFEALQHLPDDWRLWHPIEPDRPRAALTALASVGPKTVVWLNEAHHYLLHPQHGEAVAAGLRTLLADETRAPVLVMGTIWPGPGYFDDLLTTPQAGSVTQGGELQPLSPAGRSDPHNQARVLLAGRDLRVPSAFTPAQVASIEQSSDPRLAAAARSAQDGMVTQYLAAGFDLVRIYREAAPGPRALLDAAIEARRLGHPLGLPLPFLAAAAEACLTDTEWDLLPENWVHESLAQLTRPVKGVQGPLHSQKRPRGVPQSHSIVPIYRVADFLVDHCRAERRAKPVPPLFWQAAAQHCDGEGAHNLAVAAADRGLIQVACQLWAIAGRHSEIADTLVKAGRMEEAMPWFARAAQAGDLKAAHTAALELARAGRLDDVPLWADRPPGTSDNRYAKTWTATILTESGHTDAAVTWFARAADAGDTTGLLAAAEALASDGRVDEALVWFERAFAAGDDEAPAVAAEICLGTGRFDKALNWIERCQQPERASFLRQTADELTQAGREHDAIAWYARAAEAGNSTAAPQTVRTLSAMLPDSQPGPITPEPSGRRSGQDTPPSDHGQLGSVSAWAAQAETRAAARPLAAARRLADEGDIDAALQLAEEAATAGDPTALAWGAQQLADRGNWDRSLSWCRSAVAAGSEWAAHLAVVCLDELGRAREAEQLERYGWTPASDIAAPWHLKSPPSETDPSAQTQPGHNAGDQTVWSQ
ncbi:tetratricopeptide repeat protein [Streptomyces tendae]|uniref:tetratricopeptide repeat protein n=1 Tax=Streptomyces tendae TaxID=1932 RepID=UPI003787B77C